MSKSNRRRTKAEMVQVIQFVIENQERMPDAEVERALGIQNCHGSYVKRLRILHPEISPSPFAKKAEAIKKAGRVVYPERIDNHVRGKAETGWSLAKQLAEQHAAEQGE